MNKKVFIPLLIAALAIIGVMVYFLIRPRPQENIDKFNYQGATQKTLQSDNKVKITTAQGDIIVNNIFTNPLKTDSNGEQYIELANASGYSVRYVQDGDYFEIILTNKDNQNRTEAESKLTDTLGVSAEDLCKLHSFEYLQTEPTGIDEKAFDFGLSICPNSYPLQ